MNVRIFGVVYVYMSTCLACGHASLVVHAVMLYTRGWVTHTRRNIHTRALYTRGLRPGVLSTFNPTKHDSRNRFANTAFGRTQVNTNAFEIQTGPPITINTNFGMVIVSLAVANAQNDRSTVSKPEFNLQGCDFVEFCLYEGPGGLVRVTVTERWGI